MNDTTPPPDDELLSAYLDDEVTPDERARVEALAEGTQEQVRLDAMRAVRAEIGRPVVPDPDARERAVAAALAVHDELRADRPVDTDAPAGADREGAGRAGTDDASDGGGGGGGGGGGATVASLDDVRARRARRMRFVSGAAAAVVVLLVLAGVFVSLGDSRGEFSTASREKLGSASSAVGAANDGATPSTRANAPARGGTAAPSAPPSTSTPRTANADPGVAAAINLGVEAVERARCIEPCPPPPG